MTQFSAGESWDQMRFPENYCAIVGIGKGVESLETERKEPGGHSPCIVDPQGGKGSHRLQVPRAQGPLLRGLLHFYRLCFHCTFCWAPLPSFCPCCVFCLFLMGAVPYSLSPVVFCSHPHFSFPYPHLSFSCFLVSLSVGRESCPGNPPSSSFGGKDWPQESNPFSCLLETSRLIFPSEERNTKGCWPHQRISRNVF